MLSFERCFAGVPEATLEFQFCPECMAYKRMHWVSKISDQVVSMVVAAIMIAWLVTRSSVHWTSWVLAAIVLPMAVYFGWPRKNRLRCEGCGEKMPVGERL